MRQQGRRVATAVAEGATIAAAVTATVAEGTTTPDAAAAADVYAGNTGQLLLTHQPSPSHRSKGQDERGGGQRRRAESPRASLRPISSSTNGSTPSQTVMDWVPRTTPHPHRATTDIMPSTDTRDDTPDVEGAEQSQAQTLLFAPQEGMAALTGMTLLSQTVNRQAYLTQEAARTA